MYHLLPITLATYLSMPPSIHANSQPSMEDNAKQHQQRTSSQRRPIFQILLTRNLSINASINQKPRKMQQVYQKNPINTAIDNTLPTSCNPVVLRATASPVKGMEELVPLVLELPFAKAYGADGVGTVVGWKGNSISCASSSIWAVAGGNKNHVMRLTEEALLKAPAVSIAPATDAAAVVAGTMLEVVAPGVGMFNETPTAPQT